MSADEARLYRPDEPRPSASGGVPQWTQDGTQGRPPWLGVPQRHSTRRPIRATLGVCLMLVLGVGAWTTLTGRLPAFPGNTAATERGSEFPTPGFESAEHPLGIPPSPPRRIPRTASWRCKTTALAYRLRPLSPDPLRHPRNRLTAQRSQLITSAVASVSAATGLQFVYDGSTTEAPATQRPPYQPDRYGDRWAPVLFSWVTPEESPDVAGNVAGMAGSLHLNVAGSPRVYVTGSVELDAPQLSEHLYRAGGALLARAVIQHELGHLVGLDHVDDAGQLMYPETREGVTGFATGDLAGLAALGSGPCVPQL